MKVRNGFVSNSSSSSFVVESEFYDVDTTPGKWRALITQDQIRILEEYGFRKDGAHANFEYEVMVNQFDVMEFLIKNGVPFTASVHYNHSTWIWDGERDYVLKIRNLGEEVLMYYSEEDYETLIQNKLLWSGDMIKDVPLSVIVEDQS